MHTRTTIFLMNSTFSIEFDKCRIYIYLFTYDLITYLMSWFAEIWIWKWLLETLHHYLRLYIEMDIKFSETHPWYLIGMHWGVYIEWLAACTIQWVLVGGESRKVLDPAHQLATVPGLRLQNGSLQTNGWRHSGCHLITTRPMENHLKLTMLVLKVMVARWWCAGVGVNEGPNMDRAQSLKTGLAFIISD